jgi:hypothetical protein
MPSPQKRPATTGATRRGHYRSVSGVPVDAITSSGAGGGGGGGTDHGITELTGDVTAGPGDGSQAATIGANKVTTAKILDANVTTAKIADANVTTVKIADANVTTAKVADAAITSAKLRDSAALSVIGRSANSAGVPADIAAASDGDVLRRSGTSIGFGTIAAGAISDGSITLAKLADLANQRLIGRNTAGSGVPEAVTLSQLLDWISGSVARGDLAMRGAATWGRLAPGTSGFPLVSAGAAADLAYARLAYAGMQDVSATSRFLGRNTAGSGVIEEMTVAQVLTMLGFVNAGAAFYTGSGHPQGVTSAPIGNTYIDLASGVQYAKRGGGSTAYGWYPICEPAGGQFPVPWAAYPSATAGGTQQVSRTNHFGYFASSIGEAVDGWTTTGITTQSRVYVTGSNRFYASMLGSGTIDTNTYTNIVVTNATPFSLDDDADIWIDCRTGSAITTIRIWFGLTNSIITASDTFGTGNNGSILFRYSTGAGDGGWIGQNCKNGGANHSETATVAAIAASTNYRLRIRFIRGTTTAYFSVNDGTEVSLATNTPPTGASYFPIFGFTNTAASARTMLYRGWGGAFGSN